MLRLSIGSVLNNLIDVNSKLIDVLGKLHGRMEKFINSVYTWHIHTISRMIVAMTIGVQGEVPQVFSTYYWKIQFETLI